MNINIFFIVISAGLLMIFLVFKPLNIKQQKFVDVPLFQLETFTLHELNKNGLLTLMKGTKAIKYNDRYKVTDIDYTDNSKEYIANMVADDGVYKEYDEILKLNKNVVYNREDGLMFETDHITYNRKTSIASTDAKYILHNGLNQIVGSSLIYNNHLNKIKSTNVIAKYQLKEK